MTKEKYLRQEYIIFKSINYSILFVNSLQVSCIPIKISPIELVFSFFLFFFYKIYLIFLRCTMRIKCDIFIKRNKKFRSINRVVRNVICAIY